MVHFGIEIEFIVNPTKLEELGRILEKHSDILQYNLKEGNYLHRDQSILPDRMFQYGFEIQTVKMVYTSFCMEKISELLNDLSGVVIANSSCGIHVHASKPKFKLIDHYALLYELIKNNWDKQLTKIDGHRMEDGAFASYKYCRKKYYYNVNSHIRNGSKYPIKCWNESKTELFKVHHVWNTIEYRGLRHHFEDANNTTILKGINLFLSYIEDLKMNNIQENKQYFEEVED